MERECLFCGHLETDHHPTEEVNDDGVVFCDECDEVCEGVEYKEEEGN